MITVLSWTGLIVNGSVAFVLPLVLALITFEARQRSFVELEKLELLEKDSTITLAKRTLSGRALALVNSRLSFADAVAQGVTELPMPWVEIPGVQRTAQVSPYRPQSPAPTTTSDGSQVSLVDEAQSPQQITLTDSQRIRLRASPSLNAVSLLMSINPKYEEQDLILDGSVYPLFDWLKPIQTYVVSFIFFCFTIGIIFTVITNTIW